jgi:hypothetical protein
MSEEKKVPESFQAYEDGKHRRYNLLFVVNGGAFTVAQLFADERAVAVLGNLSLRQLSIGMILFTIVMIVDIFMFGEKMRTTYLPDAFGWQGKTVLVLIGILICVGWFLVQSRGNAMTWGFDSIRDILGVIVVPITLGVLALLWPTIQSAYRRRAFGRLIVRELREIGPYPESKQQGKTWVDHQTRNFVHKAIFEEPSENRDFILSLDPDLVYNVSQLWEARRSGDAKQWLWYLEQLAKKHDKSGEIAKAQISGRRSSKPLVDGFVA